jgi:hypothetical protein
VPTATPGTEVSQLPMDEFQRPLTDKGMHTASTLPGDTVVPIKLYVRVLVPNQLSLSLCSSYALSFQFFLQDPSDPTTFPGYEGVPQSPDTPQGPEPLHNGVANSLATMQTSRTRGYHGLPTV